MKKIYTWGYTGSTPDDLRQYAQAVGAVVLDIRFSPRSRVPRWERDALAAFLAEAGVVYQWVPALGNRNYKGDGLIELADPENGLKYVWTALRGGFPVILVCACKDPYECHRWDAARYLSRELGVEVEHLPGRFSRWKKEVA